jgi:hypothetical protein
MPELFTTADVAELFGLPVWKIQRLFSEGSLPDVGRFAGKRAIPKAMLPVIVDALRDRDWLPQDVPTSSTGAAP